MAQAHFGMSLAALEHEYERLRNVPSRDTVDVATLIAFHIHFRLGDSRARAIELTTTAHQLAVELNYQDGITLADLNAGFIALRHNDEALLDEVLTRTLLMIESLDNGMIHARALCLLAMNASNTGGIGNALAYGLLAYDLLKVHPWDHIGRVMVLNQLGTAYLRLLQFESAMRYFEECHTICIALGDEVRAAAVYARLASCWYEMGQLPKALQLAEEGQAKLLRLSKTYSGLGLTYCDLLRLSAKIWMQRGNFARADHYAQMARAKVESVPNWREMDLFCQSYFSTIALLGLMRWRTGDTTSALALLHEATTFEVEDLARAEMAQTYLCLSDIYREQGDFEMALAQYEQYHRCLINAETSKHHEQMQTILQMSSTIVVRHATGRLHEENAQLQQVVSDLRSLHLQVRETALRDPLTQLYNRRYLDEHLPTLLNESRRTGMPFAVAIMDMDNFKYINDTYRHTTGDAVLQMIAMLLRQNLHAKEDAVRYGGDEFLILLPQTPILVARARVEQIRRAVMMYEWNTIAPGLTVTLSAGVTDMLASDSGMSMIERADGQLLAAKRAGKNQLLMVAS